MTKQILIDECVNCPYMERYPIFDNDAFEYRCTLLHKRIPTEGIDPNCPLEDEVV